MRSNRLVAAILFLVVLAIFLPVLGYGYVWDDKLLISENPYLKRLDLLPQALLAPYFKFTSKVTLFGYYRPVPTLTFFLEYQLWGTWAAASHLINVLLHMLNGWLVIVLTRRVLLEESSNWTSYLVGALFLVTPVNVETVAWVSGRPELLATLGILAIVLLEDRAGSSRLARLGQAVIFFLALCCKEVAIIAPVLVWGYRALHRDADALHGLPALVHRAIPFAVTVVAYLALRSFAVGSSIATSMLSTAQIVRALAALGHYLGRLLLPVGLTANTQLPRADESTWFQPALGIGFLLFLAILLIRFLVGSRRPQLARDRRGDWLLHDVLWLALPILPATLVIPKTEVMPDRYLYIATIGLALLGGRLAAYPPRVATRLRYLPWLYAGALAILSVLRVPVWKSDLTLWEDATRKDPLNSLAQLNYGVALRKAGRLDEALTRYREVIALERAYPRVNGIVGSAYFNLGNIAREQGRYNEALEYYRQVLTQNPAHFVALTNVGVTFLETGRPVEAEAAFRKALQHSPEWIYAVNGLAAALGNQGRLEEAREHYARALTLDPENEIARSSLARIDEQPGDTRNEAAAPTPPGASPRP